MKRTLFAVALLTCGIGAVTAQTDPIVTRRATMKLVGDTSAEVGKMVKGEAPFDKAKVSANLKAMQDAAKIMPTLFPDSSKTGDTAAAPKIWENKADFDARFAKFGEDATSAQTKIVDEASLKTIYPELSKDCGGCHENYRLRRR